MTKTAPTILSISYDESLLRTREWILKAAGFQVTSALGFSEASDYCNRGGFDLVIIGHSLPSKDKAALVRQIRSHDHTRILSLRRAGELPMAGVDHSVDPTSVDALLEAVHHALQSQTGKAKQAGTES